MSKKSTKNSAKVLKGFLKLSKEDIDKLSRNLVKIIKPYGKGLSSIFTVNIVVIFLIFGKVLQVNINYFLLIIPLLISVVITLLPFLVVEDIIPGMRKIFSRFGTEKEEIQERSRKIADKAMDGSGSPDFLIAILTALLVVIILFLLMIASLAIGISLMNAATDLFILLLVTGLQFFITGLIASRFSCRMVHREVNKHLSKLQEFQDKITDMRIRKKELGREDIENLVDKYNREKNFEFGSTEVWGFVELCFVWFT